MALEFQPLTPTKPVPGTSSFQQWIIDLIKRLPKDPALLDAVNRLASIELLASSRSEPFELLVNRLLRACYQAAHFKPGTDRGRGYRADLQSLRGNRSKIVRRARQLADDLRKHRALMWPLAMSGYSVRVLKGPKKQFPLPNLADLLLAFADALDGKVPELDGGPFLHRFTFACLHFERPLERRRMPDVPTALLFNLVFFLRKWTASGSAFWSVGEPMPNDGRPCYDAAAALVSATLRCDMDAHKAARLLTSLQRAGGRVGLMDWN
ncbi:MAG TPA: hypothetical protein VM240_05465 [Verrucomicrobiae bacterium]|nr:hypothetical protein [Verrucomicrobiae bacterium]